MQHDKTQIRESAMPLSLAHIKLAILLSHFIICTILLNRIFQKYKNAAQALNDLCRILFAYYIAVSPPSIMNSEPVE